MGQQQLLLVILVTILVGIATVVAINVFGSAAEQANRDAVRQDLLQGASSAQAIYNQPQLLGGAGRDFNNLTAAQIAARLGLPGAVNGAVITNENGEYTVSIEGADELTITADAATYAPAISIDVEFRASPGAGQDPWLITLTDDGDEVSSDD